VSSAKEVWELSRAILADKDGYVAVLKIYMDESGTHDPSPVVTVGAYLATPREWRDWTKVWNLRKQPIKVFHANECANLRGEFDGWGDDDRNAFVAKLLPTIAEHRMVAFVIGIRMDDYREVCQAYPRMGTVIGTPYNACFQWVVQDILDWLDTMSDTQRLAFFHENNEYIAEAIATFKLTKERVDQGRRIMSLFFGSKGDFVPLQAADILAYEGNKRLRNPGTPDRRAWKAINPTGERRTVRYFDKDSLTKWAKAHYADEAA
jgi:Protein of unknown function (DUF3800)